MITTTTQPVHSAHAVDVARLRTWASPQGYRTAHRGAFTGQVCTFGHVTARTPMAMSSNGTWKRPARHLGVTIT